MVSTKLIKAIAILCATAGIAAQQPVTVTKISMGPSGREDRGTFVLNEERTIFSRIDDREVVVLFQWNGTPGAHKLVAQWRSPDGGQTSNSTIDYQAREARFGAYWTMPLTPSTPLGAWSVEVTVDGQPGGRMSFEVADRKIAGAVIKRTLSEGELFDRLNPAFVLVQRQSPRGQNLKSAGGVVREGSLFTALSAIDGIGQVRMLADGRSPLPITSLRAWSRTQDWAVSASGGLTPPDLPLAAADATKVGDRCYSIEGSATGGRALVAGTITGLRRDPQSLIAAFSSGEAMIGAPVVNEFGELIGIVGGSGVPGATREIDVIRFRAEMRGTPITPFSVVKLPVDVTPTPLEDLRAKGEVLSGTQGEDHILEAGFTRSMTAKQLRGASEVRDDFALAEKSFLVFVNWLPRERLRGQMTWRIFDNTGREVMTSPAQKADLKKDNRIVSSWEVKMLPAAGIYRVEAWLDTAVMWRGFVRITP